MNNAQYFRRFGDWKRFGHSGATRSIDPGISRFPDAQLHI
jgi:hypothetical protein